MILSFEKRFASMVLDGTKRQTIRKGRRWKVGDRADLYTGSYSAKRTLLFRAFVTEVASVNIKKARYSRELNVSVNRTTMSTLAREWLFQDDGFGDGRWLTAGVEAFEYFEKQLPFSGQLIRWDYESRFMELPNERRGAR